MELSEKENILIFEALRSHSRMLNKDQSAIESGGLVYHCIAQRVNDTSDLMDRFVDELQKKKPA